MTLQMELRHVVDRHNGWADATGYQEIVRRHMQHVGAEAVDQRGQSGGVPGDVAKGLGGVHAYQDKVDAADVGEVTVAIVRDDRAELEVA